MITITSKAEGTSNTPPKSWGNTDRPDAWSVRLRAVDEDGQRSLTVPFFTGSGLRAHGVPVPPSTGSVLECLADDAAGFDNNNGDFELWCDEYGYEGDARSTFYAVQRQTEKLRTFLGAYYDRVVFNRPEDGWYSAGAAITIEKDDDNA